MIGNIAKDSNSSNVKRRIFFLLPFYLFTFLPLFFSACTETVSDAKQETVQPQIYPDYLGVTIPVNIAPLNFNMIDETVLRIDAVIADRHGHTTCTAKVKNQSISTLTTGIHYLVRTLATRSALLFPPNITMVGTPIAPSPSLSAPIASTMVSATV